MKIEYLCDCGARNAVEKGWRPRGERPAFFHCKGCGKPSHDVCRCGHLAPVGSGHDYCQRCGAGSGDIRRGVEVVDIARNFRGVVWDLLCFAVVTIVVFQLQFGHLKFCMAHAAAVSRRLALSGSPWPPIVALVFLGAWVLRRFGPTYLAPLHALLTGEKKAPLPLRAFALAGGGAVDSDWERALTIRALGSRTRIRWMARRAWRRLPSRLRIGLRNWLKGEA